MLYRLSPTTTAIFTKIKALTAHLPYRGLHFLNCGGGHFVATFPNLSSIEHYPISGDCRVPQSYSFTEVRIPSLNTWYRVWTTPDGVPALCISNCNGMITEHITPNTGVYKIEGVMNLG